MEEKVNGETKCDLTVPIRQPTSPVDKRTRMLKTILINLSFLASLGICEGIRGPTLLDLKDIYATSIETISFMFMAHSTGSLVGSFFAGYIMDRFANHRNLIMFLYHVNIGVLTMLLPMVGHVYALFALAFVMGFNGSGIDVGGNVICLHIWRGAEGGPSMHSIHFSFALGAFIAPLIAAPFLSTRTTIIHQLEANGTNQTVIDDILEGLGDSADTQMSTLYPMVGALPLIIALGYLYFEIDSVRKRREKKRLLREQSAIFVVDHKNNADNQKWTVNLVILIAVLFAFFFLYVGAEITLGVYLTIFAVQCRLQLTKVQGATLTAIFWGAFALMRFIAIFAAMFLNPLVVMVFSFVLCLASNTVMVFLAEHSLIVLQICVAVMGVGMASIYATGLLWLERYVVITSKIGALFVIASSIGPDIYPVIIGQYITDWPMFLMYLTLGTVVVCVLLFGVASYMGRVVRREREKEEENFGGEEMVAMNGKG